MKFDRLNLNLILLKWLKHLEAAFHKRTPERKFTPEPQALDYQPGDTSITDSNLLKNYGYLCHQAAIDPEVFLNFRNTQSMYLALDHISFEQGLAYIDEIRSFQEWDRRFTEAVRIIDTLGNPRKYMFPGYGEISPTLLRYLKVYVDLQNLFGSIKNLNICEIGIGFGGQMGLIHLLENSKSYTCFDIPSVLLLAKKFMTELK